MDKLQTWDEFEKRQIAIQEMMRKRDMECVSCTKCGSQYFEQVQVMKVAADHNVILGQRIDVKAGPYIVLRCIHCQTMIEPRILDQTRDPMGGDAYGQLLDTLEGKLDERKQKNTLENTLDNPQEINDAIQGQEL